MPADSSSDSLPSSSSEDEFPDVSPIRSEEELPCAACSRPTEYGTDCAQCTVCLLWFHRTCIVPVPRPFTSAAVGEAFQRSFTCDQCVSGVQLRCAACTLPVAFATLCSTCGCPLHRHCVCATCNSCPSCRRPIISRPASALCIRCRQHVHNRPACLREEHCFQCIRHFPLCYTCFSRCPDPVACDRCGASCHRHCLVSGHCARCTSDTTVVSLHSLGSIGSCPHCRSRMFPSHPTTFCCTSGKYVLRPEDVDVHPTLYNFISNHAETLILYAREVNQLASMSSIGVHSAHRGAGGVSLQYQQSVLKISGRIYHFNVFNSNTTRSHPLLGAAQSYVFAEHPLSDPSHQFTQGTLDCAHDLRNILRQWNPFVRRLRQTLNFDYLETSYQQLFAAQSASVDIQGQLKNSSSSRGQLLLLFSLNGSCFKSPEAFAQLTETPGLEETRINFADRRYEQLTYPLLDPLQDSGWWESWSWTTGKQRFTDAAGHQLTLRQYTKSKLAQSRFLRLVPRLEQEWVLDMICRSEQMHQYFVEKIMEGTTKRVATFNQVNHARDPEALSRVSRRWTIPSSLRGSHAYRREKVEMGMAQVHALGPPTLFITMTANPKWNEIQDNLGHGCQWYHDMVLVNLVFLLKLRDFITDLKFGTFFGNRKAVYIQHVIEFQVRGLPHAHLLVRLEGEQPESAIQADTLSTCQYPSGCAALCGTCSKCRISHRVISHMMHRCYEGRCYRSGTASHHCKYGYPFAPCTDTVIGQDGMWLMKRRPCDVSVVPYHPHMLLKYDCHINTLIAAGSRCILYLRKYLSKGPDCVSARALSDCSTARQALNLFYQSRSLSSAEATWMALGFDFNGFWPTVQQVKLDLPGQQNIVFEDGDAPDELEDALARPTHIELYFRRLDDASHMSFQEYFATHSVSLATSVAKRRQTPVVVYISNLRFTNTEQFAAYSLLKVSTPRSWADLYMGKETLEEAAASFGIFNSFSSSINAAILEDWVDRQYPPEQFSTFLATILVTNPDHFTELFEHFWEHCIPMNQMMHASVALQIIANCMYADGIDVLALLSKCPHSVAQLATLIDEPDIRSFFVRGGQPSESLPLSPEQQIVHDKLSAAAHAGDRLFYINGMAGCGKTFLITHLVRKFASANQRVVCTAFTGAAALLLPSGITCHRIFGLPTEDDCEVPSTVTQNSIAGRMLIASTVVVIDEVSMLHKDFFVTIDSLLRSLMGTEASFGGKVVIVGGDFHQLPIVRHQFPLTLGFACTINRSQGRTCDRLIVDLSLPVFAHGQLYVALSRIRDPSDLVVIAPSPKVTNVVFQELLGAISVSETQ